MKTPKLFIPGPTHVASDILEAMSKSKIGHRTPEISRIIEEITEGVKDLLYTKNKVLLMSNPAFRISHMGNIYINDLVEYLEIFDQIIKD